MSDSPALTLDEAASQAWTDLFPEDATNPDEGSGPEEPEATESGEDDDEDETPPEPPEDGTEVDEDLDDDADDEPDEDEEDDPETDPAAIELSEDDVIRLPNGEEVAVKDAVLFQSGFTKKTQELAQEREELEKRSAEVEETYNQLAHWYEERAGNPAKFAAEIVTTTQDPTYTLAVLLKSLADEGRLDPAFVETFGLKSGKVAEVADSGQRDERLEKVEQQLTQQQQLAKQQERQQELVQHYLGQWDEVKQTEDLSFKSPNEEREAWRELVAFAHERQIVDLRDAYAAKAYRDRARQAPEPQRDPAVQRRKRASSAVARKSKSGGTPKAEKRKPLTTEEAAAQSLAELQAQRA